MIAHKLYATHLSSEVQTFESEQSGLTRQMLQFFAQPVSSMRVKERDKNP